MIRVDCGEEVSPGIWSWRVSALSLEGRSRQPLLDACRAIQRMGGVGEHEQIGKYREGHDEPDMWCPLAVGAAFRVSEPDHGRARFVKHQAFDPALREAAE